MAKAPAKRGPKAKDSTKKIKKKISILVSERVDYADYKVVNLLQRFVSDRSKIRARRVSGNDVQQQRDIAIAIGGDLLDVEAVECPPEVLPLAQDGEPGEPGLERLERQPLI